MKKLLLFATLIFSLTSFAQTDLIISEYVEGWSNNKALEIYNPTDAAIDLSGYRVTRYSNGTDVPPADNQWTIDLPNYSLDPYKSYVIALDKRDSGGEGQEAPVWSQLAERADVFLCPVYTTSKAMYFNGDDAVALEKTDGTLVDLFARWGAPTPADALIGGSDRIDGCWTDTPPYFSGEGVGITADHTMVKKSNIGTGITENPTIWNPLAEFDTLPANTFSCLGWHKCNNAPANQTPVFSQASYSFIVSTSAANNELIGATSATDNESDNLSFFIDYGNFVYVNDERVEPFALSKSDGKLTLVDNTGLDPAEKDLFALDILVHDGFSQTDIVNAFIAVTDNADTIALLSNITVDNKVIEGFYPFTKLYDIEVTGNTPPTISAEAINTDANVDITQATSIPGTATIEVSSKDASKTTTYTVNVSGASSINNTKAKSKIQLWPNPSTNNSFSISSTKNIKNIVVSNCIGQVVYDSKNIGSKNIDVNIANVCSGIYLVNITAEDNSIATSKIIFK